MKLLIKATASRRGLIPVKRMITRKGKPFIQTFYVRPDQAPKSQSIINRSDLPMLPAPEKKGPKGDSRLYLRRTLDGSRDEAVRIPEKAIVSKFEKFGQQFVVHHTIYKDNTIGLNDYHITEISSGKKLMENDSGESPEDMKKRAVEMLENIGEEKVVSTIQNAEPLANADIDFIEDTDDFEMPTPATEYDFKNIENHIMEILEIDDPDYAPDNLSEWVRKNIETDEDAKSFLDHYNENNWYEMQIAIEGDMDMEDATSTANALAYIDQHAGGTYGSVDIDSIRQWWENQGSPVLESNEVWNMGSSNEYMEIDEEDALSYMINENLSPEETEDWVQEQLDEAEESHTVELEDFEMTTSDGQVWTGEELEQVGQWVAGGVVKETRTLVKEADNRRRSGLDTDTDIYTTVNDIIEERMDGYEGEYLYRGTQNPLWETAMVGEKIPLGLASFSQSKHIAESFAGSQHVVIILENKDDIQGLNLMELISEVNDEDEDIAAKSGIKEHEHEQEFIVRAPSIEITKVEAPASGGYGHIYVYARVTEMDLLKSMMAEMSARISEMESIFDEPLHRRIDDPVIES